METRTTTPFPVVDCTNETCDRNVPKSKVELHNSARCPVCQDYHQLTGDELDKTQPTDEYLQDLQDARYV